MVRLVVVGTLAAVVLVVGKMSELIECIEMDELCVDLNGSSTGTCSWIYSR